MSTWLDTETKAILQGVPPTKLARPLVFTFTVVLLTKGQDHERMIRAVNRIVPGEAELPETNLAGPCPLVVCAGLTQDDALLGQFELISCDAISVFLRDEVVSEGEPSYLQNLYTTIREGLEFAEESIRVVSVPNDPRGDRFLDQFVGPPGVVRQDLQSGEGFHLRVPRRKAKLMRHWAKKTGGIMVGGER